MAVTRSSATKSSKPSKIDILIHNTSLDEAIVPLLRAVGLLQVGRITPTELATAVGNSDWDYDNIAEGATEELIKYGYTVPVKVAL